MILTDKAKEDFLKWAKKRCNVKLHELIKMEMWINIQDEIFVNSLIIEWFDSIGIFINVNSDYIGGYFSKLVVIKNGKVKEYGEIKNNCFIIFKTRQEATIQAIIKANEIFNLNLTKL